MNTSALYLLPFKNEQYFKIGITRNLETYLRLINIDKMFRVDFSKAYLVNSTHTYIMKTIEKQLLNENPFEIPLEYKGISGSQEIRPMSFFYKFLEELEEKKNTKPHLGITIKKDLSGLVPEYTGEKINKNIIVKVRNVSNKLDYKFFFDRLKQARKNEKITQNDLAKIIGKQQSHIFQMETNGNFALDTIFPIIHYFSEEYGYNINWFMKKDVTTIRMKVVNEQKFTQNLIADFIDIRDKLNAVQFI